MRVDDDFERRLYTSGRVNGPRILIGAWSRNEIDNATLREHVLDVWQAVEWPLQAATVDVWLAVFNATGPIHEIPVEDATTVYRGQVGDEIGMAWTSDLDVAKWFHSRNIKFKFDGPRLLKAVAPKDSVLVHFMSRDGDEYIVDPERLTSIIEID